MFVETTLKRMTLRMWALLLLITWRSLRMEYYQKEDKVGFLGLLETGLVLLN
jgi:hypothetical protein